MVDVAQVLGVHVGHAHHVGQLVEVLLRHLAFVDDDGVVQVASLDEARLEQRLYFAHKDEGAAGGHFVLEFAHIFQRGKLVGKDARVVGDEHVQAEALVGQQDDGRTGLLVAELRLRLDDVEVLHRVLLLRAYAFYFVDVILGASVQDGEFGAVHLYQAVVYAQGVEGCHAMFHGADLHVVLGQHGAACRLDHVLGYGVDDGLSFQVGPLDLVSVVLGSRVEGYGQVEARVKTFAAERKAFFQSPLFQHGLFL